MRHRGAVGWVDGHASIKRKFYLTEKERKSPEWLGYIEGDLGFIKSSSSESNGGVAVAYFFPSSSLFYKAERNTFIPIRQDLWALLFFAFFHPRYTLTYSIFNYHRDLWLFVATPKQKRKMAPCRARHFFLFLHFHFSFLKIKKKKIVLRVVIGFILAWPSKRSSCRLLFN